MRVVNGMHISNSHHYGVEQSLQAARVDGAVTILHHQMFPRDEVVDQWGDVENEYWYGKLRHGYPPQGIAPAPKRLIHVRMFQPNWRDYDPKLIAQQCVKLLSNWQGGGRTANLLMDPYVTVSPCNEQNLEPVGDKDYALHARWQLAFWAEMDKIAPDRKATSCLGAWAYGGDIIPDVPDSEYTDPTVRKLLDYVDILATHPYGHMEFPGGGLETLPGGKDAYWHMLRDFRPVGWRDDVQPGHKHDIGGLLAQYPGKPLLISECGTFAHSDKGRAVVTLKAMADTLAVAAASGRVLGVTWFIWNSGPEHGHNCIWDNEALRNGLMNIPDYPTPCAVPVRGAGTSPPVPLPGPTPPAGKPGGEVHIVVKKSEGWMKVASRLLGRQATVAEANALADYNGHIALHPHVCVRSPWHDPCVKK